MPHLSVFSPVDHLTLHEEGGRLVSLDWGWVPDGTETPLLTEARAQLEAYFDGRLTAFDLPLDPGGTAFQRRVWAAMSEIPWGQTQTYGDLAATLQSSPRAVGGACGRNPLPILIPCHRVLARDGQAGGYSGGWGLATKYELLRREGVPGLDPSRFQ
ncbi:methylated-DNA--[protein]-cysteine S-methyltransferase [Roseospirillum parvum]|uniref:Methylated-DNA--protein-cysteine methyltransferase n=1 Tax=Roseospirillum parvum TaxID=83401 RepID=A0A1G8DS19_9PROT|nr:methylated-DNA--[protein]-cysteine S-methyltransferase [Roseospirillum parvum]SDH60484.1 methylated-DNA-[protein]-cysteine S-methyltransferase [Roseospirillum parvum]